MPISESVKKDSILIKLIPDIINKYHDNIISIFGIGSYFDDSLPSDWIKSDLDIIVIVKDLEAITKTNWIDNKKYKKIEYRNYKIWIAFNSLDSLHNQEIFEKESFANYKWALIDLKIPQNSKLLYGKEIRNSLPDLNSIPFNYDDILKRTLYHFEKSLQKIDRNESQNEFTKGVFKFGFYLCVFYDNSYCRTSIREITNKLKKLNFSERIERIIINIVNEAIEYRSANKFKTEFIKLRNDFVHYVFILLCNGSLHRRMNFQEIIIFLKDTFGGLIHLIRLAKAEYYASDNYKCKTLEKELSMYKLCGSLVPEKSFYSNLRKFLPQEEWDILRRAVYKKERNKCHICGIANIQLEAHEKWLYDYDNSTQKLQNIIALCKMCHLNNHLGFSNVLIVEEKLDKKNLIRHWCQVNNKKEKEFEAYEEKVWRLWDLRNNFTWKIVDHNDNEITHNTKLYDLLKLIAQNYLK